MERFENFPQISLVFYRALLSEWRAELLQKCPDWNEQEIEMELRNNLARLLSNDRFDLEAIKLANGIYDAVYEEVAI